MDCALHVQKKRLISRQGFSTLELLLVLAIMGVILLVTIPALYRLLQSYRLQSSVNLIATNVRFARAAALKQKIPFKLIFRDRTEINGNTYSIEFDPSRTGSFLNFDNVDTTLQSGITIEPTSIDQVTFDSRGASNVAGFVLLKGINGDQYKVTISLIGAVNVEK